MKPDGLTSVGIANPQVLLVQGRTERAIVWQGPIDLAQCQVVVWDPRGGSVRCS